MKPTIIYVLFGAILLGGLWFNKPLLAIVFDSVFDLTEEGWRKLTLRWAIFFLALAVLNEIVWRTQSTDFWVSFKVFGVVPLTFVFAALQFPLLQKYATREGRMKISLRLRAHRRSWRIAWLGSARRRNKSPAARRSERGRHREAERHQHARAADRREPHFHVALRDQILDRLAFRPVTGDRPVQHGADDDRTLIALVGLDLIHALEHEIDVGTIAAVEDRKFAPAGFRRNGLRPCRRPVSTRRSSDRPLPCGALR